MVLALTVLEGSWGPVLAHVRASRSQFSNPLLVKRWWTSSRGWWLWNVSWLEMYGCFHNLYPSIGPWLCSSLSSALTSLEHPASAFLSLLGFLLPLRLGPFPLCSGHSDDLIRSSLQPQISLTSRPNRGINTSETANHSMGTRVPGTPSLLSVRKRLAITYSPLHLPPSPLNNHCQHRPYSSNTSAGGATFHDHDGITLTLLVTV